MQNNQLNQHFLRCDFILENYSDLNEPRFITNNTQNKRHNPNIFLLPSVQHTHRTITDKKLIKVQSPVLCAGFIKVKLWKLLQISSAKSLSYLIHLYLHFRFLVGCEVDQFVP